VFRYSFPQFVGGKTAEALNAAYAAQCRDMLDTLVPRNVGEAGPLPEAGMPPYQSELSYRLTANTDDYLSVLLINRQSLGNAESETWTASVYALNGVYEGQTVSLSQVTGMEQEEGDASGSYAASLVYRLVWQIIQEQQAIRQNYFPDLTLDDFKRSFSPETDFYLDADGNLVFFVQAGVIASEMDGILTYPFSLAELLASVKEQTSGRVPATFPALPIAKWGRG
jgi:hypothetical protein